MSAEEFKALLHHHVTENILLVFTSTLFIFSFTAVETVLADHLAAYYCKNQQCSPLSGRSQLSRDLEVQSRERGVRGAVGDRIEAYLKLRMATKEGKVQDGAQIELPTYTQSESQRLLGDEEVFAIADD